jgi:hypothetical protein
MKIEIDTTQVVGSVRQFMRRRESDVALAVIAVCAGFSVHFVYVTNQYGLGTGLAVLGLGIIGRRMA